MILSGQKTVKHSVKGEHNMLNVHATSPQQSTA